VVADGGVAAAAVVVVADGGVAAAAAAAAVAAASHLPAGRRAQFEMWIGYTSGIASTGDGFGRRASGL